MSSCSPSSFTGSPISLSRLHPPYPTTLRPRTLVPITMMVKPALQFIQGTDELTIPDVKLTRSRDGSNGMALFSFDQPSVFDSSGEVGEITGLYMIDEEGVIQSTDVNARFVNGKPEGIVAKHVMRTPKEWDRFMRFMERYSDQNGLQFVKKQWGWGLFYEQNVYVTFQKKKKLLVYNFSHSFDHYLSFQFFNGTFIRMVIMPPAPRLFYNQRSGSCNGNPKPPKWFLPIHSHGLKDQVET